MEVEELVDAEAVAQRAAIVIASEIETRGARDVVLAGGSSPMRAYELLGDMVSDWSPVHLWYGDERCVPPHHEDSNHGQAAGRLHAPGATWHPMPGALGPRDGAAAYGAELGRTPLDLVLLGMGPDGHTASLFPDHPLLDLPQGPRTAGLDDAPKPPPERITLTLDAINRARRIVLLVTGEAKRGALARLVDGAPDRSTPVTLLARDRLLVLADPDAMGETATR